MGNWKEGFGMQKEKKTKLGKLRCELCSVGCVEINICVDLKVRCNVEYGGGDAEVL